VGIRIDNDGNVDIASPDLFGPVVRRGRGDATFGRRMVISDVYSEGAATADFNRDGRPDLAFAGTCDGPDCNDQVTDAWVLLNATG
jgi:VCBS repeat protein